MEPQELATLKPLDEVWIGHRHSGRRKSKTATVSRITKSQIIMGNGDKYWLKNGLGVGGLGGWISERMTAEDKEQRRAEALQEAQDETARINKENKINERRSRLYAFVPTGARVAINREHFREEVRWDLVFSRLTDEQVESFLTSPAVAEWCKNNLEEK